jgi:hypothetical protein
MKQPTPPSRVHWTGNEKELIANRAQQIKTEHAQLSWLNAIQSAQEAIPIPRRRFNLGWHDVRPILDLLRLDGRGKPLPPPPPPPQPKPEQQPEIFGIVDQLIEEAEDARARTNQPGRSLRDRLIYKISQPAVEEGQPAVEEGQPPVEKVEPELSGYPDLTQISTADIIITAVARGRELLNQLQGIYTVVQNQQAAQDAFVSKQQEAQDAFVKKIEAAIKDAHDAFMRQAEARLKDMVVTLGQFEEKIATCDGRIKAAEDMVVDELDKLNRKPESTPPAATVSSKPPPPPPPPAEPKPVEQPRKPAAPPIPKPPGPKAEILLIGPRPDDFRYISEKVDHLHVELTLLDKRANHVSVGYDFALVSQKFAGRYWHEAHQIYGAKAVSVPGGSSNVVNAIEQCALRYMNDHPEWEGITFQLPPK